MKGLAGAVLFSLRLSHRCARESLDGHQQDRLSGLRV